MPALRYNGNMNYPDQPAPDYASYPLPQDRPIPQVSQVTAPFAAVGAGVAAAGGILDAASSAYMSYQALEDAKRQRRREQQRQELADQIAQQDRKDNRRHDQNQEQMAYAGYGNDQLSKMFDLYKNYGGGYFSLHGG